MDNAAYLDRAVYVNRVLALYKAYHASERSSGMGPQELNQAQVAALCLTHQLAVVPSCGILRCGWGPQKKVRYSCGKKNCKQPGRHPRTPNGVEDATTDLNAAHRLWTESPNAKVIIATGKADVMGLTVIGRQGQQFFKALVGEADETSPETIKFRGRRTVTYLFRAPANAIPDGRIKLAPGVVVHGHGSFIIVPRNVTRPGRYKQLCVKDITRPPNWLLRLLGSKPIVEPTSAEKLPISEPKPAERPMISERTFPETFVFEFVRIPLDGIVVPDGTPRCNDDKVRALAESYRITDLRRPLAVRLVAERTRESDPVVRLLSDPHQLAALKRLGITCADCLLIKGGETGERLWKLAELIHQPEVKVLDWALAVMEWVTIVRAKGAHVAHPRGGRQPHDKGFAAAQRVFGVSRRDLARAALIAKISVAAQEEIRRAKLDDIQRALLEIANATPEEQVEKARELKEHYSKPRQKRAPNADTEPEAGTRKDPVLDDEPTSPGPAEEEDDQPEDTVPEKTPDDMGQPSPLERCISDDERLDRVLVVWDQFVVPEWAPASEAVRLRFFEALGYSVMAANKTGESHH